MRLRRLRHLLRLLLICKCLMLSKMYTNLGEGILEVGNLLPVFADDLVGCSQDASQIVNLITKLHELMCLRPLIILQLK